MRTRWILLIAAAALTVTAFGCATRRSPGERFDDAWITSKVKTKIAADTTVNPFEINVDTRAGVVYLRGAVEEEEDRRQAERIARDTKGVVDVRNEIEIGDPTTRENMSDAWILTKVKSKLAGDSEINPFNIDVDVSRGVVTLSGTVAKSEARRQAEALARETKGVKDVRNEIEVE